MKRIFLGIFITFVLVQCQREVDLISPPNPIDTIQTPGNATLLRLLDSTQLVTDLKLLSSALYGGRKAGTAEVSLTHQLIQRRLREAGVDSFSIGFAQDFTYSSVNRKNLLGLVRGTVNPQQYIVVGAHYDHLGKNSTGTVYHGADDNASGVATVLAMAKYFQAHKPKFTVIFALWDAEEVGLQGSKYFVNNLPSGITLSQLKFNLNADMLARSDNNSIWASGLFHNPSFRYLVDSIAPRSATILKSGYDKPTDAQDWTLLSDHASFFQKNIPFLYLGVEDHADYHKVTDTYEKVNLNRFTENANIFLQMALLLDRKL